MNINFELGIIYDTLRFFEIYFNNDEIIKDLENRNYDIKEDLKYYKKIKKDIEILPQLHAFFDLNKNEKSLLTGLFIDEIENINTINDYLSLLKHKDLILCNLIDYYFDEITEQEKEKLRKNYNKNIYIKNIFSLEINSKTKISLALIFTDYDNIISLLVNSISNTYNNVVLLHENNRKLILEFEIKEKYINKLIDIAKVESFDNATYCLSLLHCHLVKTINNKFIVFGIYYEDALDKKHTFLNVTLETLCSAFGNKLNMLIIDIMHKHKKIHVAGIIKLLPTEYSILTVYRIIANLYREKVIVITENKNKKIYYSLNLGYFENAINIKLKSQINKKLDDFVSIINNHYMNEILNIISLNSNISGYEIVKRLDSSSYSSSSIYRFIKILYLNNLIYISEQKYQYKYYSINRNYFKELNKIMNEYIKYYKDEKLSFNELEKYLAIYS